MQYIFWYKTQNDSSIEPYKQSTIEKLSCMHKQTQSAFAVVESELKKIHTEICVIKTASGQVVNTTSTASSIMAAVATTIKETKLASKFISLTFRGENFRILIHTLISVSFSSLSYFRLSLFPPVEEYLGFWTQLHFFKCLAKLCIYEFIAICWVLEFWRRWIILQH